MYKGYKVAHSNNLEIYIEILQSSIRNIVICQNSQCKSVVNTSITSGPNKLVQGRFEVFEVIFTCTCECFRNNFAVKKHGVNCWENNGGTV